jgi:hypothetical protein
MIEAQDRAQIHPLMIDVFAGPRRHLLLQPIQTSRRFSLEQSPLPGGWIHCSSCGVSFLLREQCLCQPVWMSADRVLLAANDVLNRKFAPLVDDGRQVCAGN